MEDSNLKFTTSSCSVGIDAFKYLFENCYEAKETAVDGKSFVDKKHNHVIVKGEAKVFLKYVV